MTRADEAMGESTEVADDAEVHEIFQSMKNAIDDDAESLRNGRPALAKLSYSKDLVGVLKNLKTQEVFLFKNGLAMLKQWISKNQDGSYPCINVLEDALTILEDLRIEQHHLQESKVGKVVKKLSTEGASESVRRRSHHLVTKWYRLIYNLNGGYDGSG